jgi:hypothetical protein
MQLETVQYHLSTGWSQPLPVALDSPSTLVLVFGARRLSDHARHLTRSSMPFRTRS